MVTCYVIVREGVSGGTGTLSYRILNYLKNKGFHCAYLCCENNAPDNLKMIKKSADYVEIADDLSYRTQFERIHDKFQSFTVLTYSIKEYLAIDKLRKLYPSISRSFLYVVHAFAFSVPPELKASSLKRFIMKVSLMVRYRYLVKSLVRNGAILFMDMQSVQETEHSLKICISRDLIQRLPIEIRRYSKEYWDTIARQTPFTIGTMCRMDFPFKGYVLGLIDQFVLLYKKYNVRLFIVGDGPNGEALRKKIMDLPLEIRDKITYQRSISYSDLGFFYSKCDLAVGMGTMLLDAANYNVLAVPVNAYTNSLEAGGLFLDNIDWLLLKGEKVCFEDLLQRVLNLSQKEFAELVHEQYQRLQTYYSIEKFCNIYVGTTIGQSHLKCHHKIFYNIINILR